MTICLTPEQEKRVQAVLGCGAYQSVGELLDTGLSAVEQCLVPNFAGSQEELDALLSEGLASQEVSEEGFWDAVGAQTDALLARHKIGIHW